MATIDGSNKKLSVSGEQIEESVGKSHEHSNSDVLDKLSDDNGTLQYNGSDITGGSATEYELPTATTTTLGGVKVDGTTITVNGDGIISSVVTGSGELEFLDTNVTRNVSARVDESLVKQEYLGGYIEIQPDSWDGAVTSTDATTKTWGFPFSLLPTERKRVKNDLFKGDEKGIQYFRFPLGFAYRGYRNIDEKSGKAKNIGERFKGQNATLKEWFKDIAVNGGGLAPEYWCPAPYWVTSGSYSGENRLSAGGSYPQSTTLASIKTTDTTQYNAQIEAFANAVVDDLEYLHQNVAPVRMFGLQNEPTYSTQNYGACSYDAQTYNDVLEVVWRKIKESTVLATYNDEVNEVKLLVASSDESTPFKGIAATYINNHADTIWGYTHHSMREASGESFSEGAEWYKSGMFSAIKGSKKNVFINEYEYFGNTVTNDNFRCSNNMLHLINELVYGEAKVLHPVIHVCKPIGQTLASTNTKGYCLYQANLNGSYGVDVTAESNEHGLLKGTVAPNETMYNSWKMFSDNLPVGSYVIGSYSNTITRGGWVTLKHGGKLYVFIANTKNEDMKVTLTFGQSLTFEGKAYSLKYLGDKIKPKSGSTIEFVVPAYSGQCWISNEHTYTPTTTTVECTGISLNNSNLTFTTGTTQTLSATVTPTDCTQTVTWLSNAPGVATVNNGVVTPVSNGTATITATCGSHSATCKVTVSLKTLSSISAVYTQGDSVVYPSTSLNDLKSNLAVTATYSDDTTATITDYKLSGTLTVGNSTVTVTYSGKTTTFNVTVSEEEPTTTSYVAGYYNDSGELVTAEHNYVDNKYIPVESGATYNLNTTVGVENMRWNEYDSNKNFIRRKYDSPDPNGKTWCLCTTSSTTAYVRVGFLVLADKDNEQDLETLFSNYTFKK